MSNVYLAVARGPGGVNKLVVLKAVLPELASEPSALSMFLDEARLAVQLNHPNVVQTYDVGSEGNRHVIVMEYLEGETLAQVTCRAEQNGQPMSTAMQLRVLINVLEGLHYAHELCAYDGSPLMLVHRDVSPQNIFLTYGGHVKVLDFGIAKAASSSTETVTGVVKGKIAYMAPEQMIAESLDRRADIYSVGCVLWGVATGKKLWKDTPDVQTIRRVINGDIPTPQSVNRACDDELNQIVMKAIASDPDQRYPTALALQEELERYSDRFTSPVKQKDIGAFVSTLFAHERAESKALIERQLSMNDETGVNPQGSDVRVDAPRGTWQELRGASESRSDSSHSQGGLSSGNHDAQTGTAASPRRLIWPVAVAGLMLLAGSVTYFSRTVPSSTKIANAPSTQASTPAAPPAPAPAPAPPAPGAAPTTSTLEFRAQPAQAQLYVDDRRLPSNPASLQLPIGNRPHRLRAEAPGYVSSSSEFSALHDGRIEIVLNAAGAANLVRVPSGGAQQVKHTPAAVGAPSAKGVGCAQQPFMVDADGIKKFRPECL
jgi:serine/threonine-protein kinase